MTSNNTTNMWALMASGNRRKKRTTKVAKKHLPKRRTKHQLHVKKRQKKAAKKHYKKRYHKPKPKKRYKRKKPVRRKYKKRYHKRTGLTKAESAAKEWISWHESRDRWNASNGICYGRYQLTPSYLHGDYSHYNQSKTADRYVHTRYGSWLNAKAFWQVHHWY